MYLFLTLDFEVYIGAKSIFLTFLGSDLILVVLMYYNITQEHNRMQGKVEMYSIQKNLSSISGGVIVACVILLVIAVGGYQQVRQIFAKSAILFAFFATFFHAKIAMALENSKDSVVNVTSSHKISNDDPWKIVDNQDDPWKKAPTDTAPESTSTSSTSTSTTSTTQPTDNDEWQQVELETTTTIPSTTLPSTQTKVPSQTPTPTSVTPSATQNVQSSAETTHLVVKGENLYTIAKQYAKDTSSINKLWVKIITVNKSNLASKNPNLIYAGETIIIPPI